MIFYEKLRKCIVKYMQVFHYDENKRGGTD